MGTTKAYESSVGADMGAASGPCLEDDLTISSASTPVHTVILFLSVFS